MPSEDEARSVIQRVLGKSRADDVEIELEDEQVTHLRFARNNPTTSGAFADRRLTVKSSFGQRSASASINQLDDAAIESVVRRSEALARIAPEDPEHMPSLGPEVYAPSRAHDPRAEQAPGEVMARGTALCIEQARARRLVAAGFSLGKVATHTFATKHGAFAHCRSSSAFFSETARTAEVPAPDAMRSARMEGELEPVSGSGSGWASSVANTSHDLDYAGCSASALDKAERSREPKALAPGKYVVILEPACVASLVQSLVASMNRRSADEGRSFFSAPEGRSRSGEQLFPELVNIHSDPADERAPGLPWLDGGLPQRRRAWIEDGRVRTLACDRFWAAKHDLEPVPRPSNVLMQGGNASVADLIASTPRGVLITSLWYIRQVDPRTLLLTGLTRDGVFWIEDGKIVHPVQNFRWNNSPVHVLKNIEAMSHAVRVSPRAQDFAGMCVPALLVRDFELSSPSEAV